MTSKATHADVEELYRRHAGELHGYLYRRVGPAASDLLAEVFVVALERLDALPEAELRRAWLFGAARRILLADDRGRRKRSHAEREHGRWHSPPGAGEDDGASALAAAVSDALSSLREPDRELIRLTEWERLDVAEVALVLGVRPGTARVRLHRARRRLAAHPSLQRLVDGRADPLLGVSR